MKFPETAADVAGEILHSVSNYQAHQTLRVSQLARILQKADPEIVVEGIIRILERGTGSKDYAAQEFAGRILEAVRPQSRKELKEVLQRGLKGWDKSVEQFPFWLKNNYGMAALKEAFAELKLTEPEMDRLLTLQWWLRCGEAGG